MPSILPDTADGDGISRQGLVMSLLERPEPLVVLEAPFGMGKSTLLRALAKTAGVPVHLGHSPPPEGAALRLWDLETLPAGAPLADFAAGKLILAKRPETRIPGLERAIAYGHAAVLRTEELLFTEAELSRELGAQQAARLLRQTGGWPLALAAGLRQMDPHHLAALFESEFVRHLAAPDLVWLDGHLAGIARTRPPPDLQALIAPPSGSLLASSAIREALTELRRRRDPHPHRPAGSASPARLCPAYRRAGAGRDRGPAERRATPGPRWPCWPPSRVFFASIAMAPKPSNGCWQVSTMKPTKGDEALVICRCLQALKHGDVARTRQVVADRFGADALNPLIVFSGRAEYSLPFRLFRVVLLIYEDISISERHLEQMFRLIGEVPADDHFERGSFYNAILEIYIRGRRFAEAAEAAQRALFHYTAADLPFLQFYIRLHQSVIRLMEGNSRGAQKLAAAARADLRRCGFESPDDLRLLTLLTACADYEAGNAEPLARFLGKEFNDFSHAELWPTVVELAVHYGGLALSEQFSTYAAIGFLDRWRVHQAQNRQFQTLLALREAAILQNGNRWHEAGEVLAGVLPGIDRAWAMSPAADLARLEERDMLTLALAWLRQVVFETPQREGLPAQLESMRANLHLTGRQRLALDLWRAYVLRHRKNHAHARRTLERLLDSAGHLGAVAVLAEQRYFLDELLGQKRLESMLNLSEAAQQILRRLKNRGLTIRLPGAHSSLTRRETRMLMMISDGSSNKFIAKTLGISESTVKFHLKNLYQKLGCHRRREAIDAARALRLTA